MILYWNFDPVLIAVGPLSIRWYGLLFASAFLVGQVLMKRMFRKEGLDRVKVEQLLVYAVFGTVIGARLVHCALYDPLYYLADPLAILRIWEGGLASHGGAVGMLLGLWLGNRNVATGRTLVWLVDRVSIVAALGGAFVRVANFLNSEIVGVPTSGRWGVVFESVDTLPRHPVQLYEATGYLLTFVLLLGLYGTYRDRTPSGLLAGIFLLLVFAVRIGAEFFKMPQASYEVGQMFTVGQYLSLPCVILGGVMVVRALIGKKRQTSG